MMAELITQQMPEILSALEEEMTILNRCFKQYAELRAREIYGNDQNEQR